MSFSSGHWDSNGNELCPLLDELFVYSYESEFLDNMKRSGHRKLARSFNLCHRYRLFLTTRDPTEPILDRAF